jgi:hypothetical protein
MDLARLLGTSRPTMAGTLVRLHGLALIISQPDGTWQFVR